VKEGMRTKQQIKEKIKQLLKRANEEERGPHSTLEFSNHLINARELRADAYLLEWVLNEKKKSSNVTTH
jgi:peptide subunit release factor 1 (eRF1)